MTSVASASSETFMYFQWMWNVTVDPSSESKISQWKHYSDIENMIIEEAFMAGDTCAWLDDYYIDFENNIQIDINDPQQTHSVQRIMCSTDVRDKQEERFMLRPVYLKQSFSDLYKSISPFMKAVKEYLKIRKNQMPSKTGKKIPMIVKKAAVGIIEESKLIGKQCEGEKLAKILLEKVHSEVQDVWTCCAYLYTLESFLYKKIDETLQLIGNEETEKEWISKVHTLGPFCLLLWDHPFKNRGTTTDMILYRGTKLTGVLLSMFIEDSSKAEKELRCFPQVISCSPDRIAAEKFGNTLFIMEVKKAFTVNFKSYFGYRDKGEELLLPCVCFTVDRVEFDEQKEKHLIYLKVRQHDPSK